MCTFATYDTHSRSVQSETRYGIIEEAEKQKMRFDKLKQVSPRNWSVVGGIRHVHAPGIDAGTQYTELWRLARCVMVSVALHTHLVFNSVLLLPRLRQVLSRGSQGRRPCFHHSGATWERFSNICV